MAVSLKPKVYTFFLSLPDIARGLRVSETVAKGILQNGRGACWWGEIWASNIYKTTLAKLDHYGTDLVGSKDSDYSVKTLTKNGVHVRRSKNTGVGRRCSGADVTSLIKQADGHIFIDITEVPKVSVVKLTSGTVMEWYQNQVINNRDGAISYSRFYAALGDYEEIPFEMPSNAE